MGIGLVALNSWAIVTIFVTMCTVLAVEVLFLDGLNLWGILPHGQFKWFEFVPKLIEIWLLEVAGILFTKMWVEFCPLVFGVIHLPCLTILTNKIS